MSVIAFLTSFALLLPVAASAQTADESTDNSSSTQEAPADAPAEAVAEVPASDAAPAEAATEAPSETVADESPSEAPTPAPIEDLSPACDSMYLNYVRGLPKAKQKAEFETWWQYEDRSYRNIKGDEFAFREQQPKKLKQFEELLAAPAATYTLPATVKLGSYDFKKKGFPVDILTEKKNKTIENHSTGAMFSGIGGADMAYIMCHAGISNMDKKKVMPAYARFKFSNLENLKFFPVAEDKAKLITGEIRNSRTTTMRFRFTPAKTAMVKGFNQHELVTEGKVTEMEMGWQESLVSTKK